MNATTNALTLADMRKRWIGRLVRGSTDSGLDAAYSRAHAREVEDIYQNKEDGMYYAFSDEHHRANTLEGLDRRLHSLAL